MKNLEKILCLLLAIAIVFTNAAACSKKDNTGDSSKDAAKKDSEELDPVHLVMYFVSEAPSDIDLVVDELNKKLKEDLNTTIEIKFTTWTDYTQKYDLALKTDDEIDLVYSAPWMSYSNYSNQGAYLELEDLLPKYAPTLWEQIDETVWNQVKVGGHIYGVPAMTKTFGSKGINYRVDLQQKYNLPIPNSIENVEKYIMGIKENMPDQGLIRTYVEQTATGELFAAHSMVLNLRYPMVREEGTYYGLYSTYDNPSELINYWDSDDFVEDMHLMKKWADLGFWSRDVLGETPDVDSYNVGKTVLEASGTNPGKASGAQQQLKAVNPEWENGYATYAEIHGYAYHNTPMTDMMSVTYRSKNPERALMVLEKLLTDESYNKLIQYGIEGKHYNLLEGEVYEPILDADGNSGYGYGDFAWSLVNDNFGFKSTDSGYYEDIINRLEKVRENTPFGAADIAGGFIEHSEEYQAEVAALGNVMMNYLAPLEAGLVDDVDEAIATFREKAKAAGIDKIHEKFKEQWAAYCEEYGYVKNKH